MGSKRTYRKGMLVNFTVRGGQVVGTLNDGRLIVKDGNGSIWNISPDDTSTEVSAIVPPHKPLKPGQVWRTTSGDRFTQWFVRRSRPDIPYRVTPDDLTAESGLKTLTEEEFFLQYPDATLVYPGNGEQSVPIHLFNKTTPGAADNGINNRYFGETLAPANK